MNWRVIAEAPDYEVSDTGVVRRLVASKSGGVVPAGHVLTPSNDQSGYPRVNLYRDGWRKAFRVHRLVAEAFLGPCPPGCLVAHNDGDPGNAALENLRYASAQENMDDRGKHGTVPRGESHYAVKIPTATVEKLRADFDGGVSIAALARKHQVGYAVAWKICNRLGRLAGMFLVVFLAGCAPREIAIKLDGGSSAANAVACAVFDPIYLEEQEIVDLTRKSKEKIAGHNAAWEKLCGEDK